VVDVASSIVVSVLDGVSTTVVSVVSDTSVTSLACTPELWAGEPPVAANAAAVPPETTNTAVATVTFSARCRPSMGPPWGQFDVVIGVNVERARPGTARGQISRKWL